VRLHLAAVAALLVVASSLPPQPSKSLTAAPQLVRAYNAIFDARFDDVPAVLTQTCPR
jgi:hypothetical protein